MDFTNINDPAGVKALLESLRSSQAWAETVSTTPNPSTALSGSSAVISSSPQHQKHPLIPTPSDSTALQDSGISTPSTSSKPSVAQLLSQLRNSSSRIASDSGPSRHAYALAPAYSPPPSSEPSYAPLSVSVEPLAYEDTAPLPIPKQDVRALTFQQALPLLAQLVETSGFVDAVTTIKQEQEKLERRLWEERAAIQKKHDEKVKVARTKAALVGAGLSKHDADMMSDSFRQELSRFDLQRVLPAWDGLVAKHQGALEALGVPTMFVTSAAADREKQQKVMLVLEGLAGSST
ncbi:hypothetical protein BV25DRAFT_1791703 [Artomyces pyxidatus]|uniref:Uncharacterized protein n=1 Tax=Artomyces pyxidatus TaxID=48021 RepID=A0ACB8TLA4_9AGAM|nr:hypothetical protein BV25DRAFT_1791703 [Artomyces pyxidatus]